MRIKVWYNFQIVAEKSLFEERFHQFFMSSLILDVFIGVLYIFAVFAFGRAIFGGVYGLTNEALDAAMVYSYITSPYLLLQLMIFTLNSYFKITKNTEKLMFVSTCAAVMNAVLDYLLIFGKFGLPKLGTAGAAWASIISVSLNAIVLLLFAVKDIKIDRSPKKIYKEISVKLIKESIPLVGEELLEGSIFVVFMNALISNIGITEMSSYLLVKSLIDIVLISMYMYGSAEMTLASEKLGQSKWSEIMDITRVGIFISLIIYVILGIVLILFRNTAPMIISDDADLIAYASRLIIPMILMNLFNPVQTILKYVLQACKEANFVLYFTAIVNVIVLGVVFVLYLLDFKMISIFTGLFMNYFILSVMYYVRLMKKERNARKIRA